jgi:hypothetical protein
MVGGRRRNRSPPNGGAESGSKGNTLSSLSVRPLASFSSSSASASACGIAAVTVPDASLDREVQACGRGYANAHQQCCRLSLVTLTASHRQHPAYSHEPAQGPQPTTTPGRLGAAPDAVSPYAPPQVCIRTASSSLHPICSQPQRTCDTVWPPTCCVRPQTRPSILTRSVPFPTHVIQSNGPSPRFFK